MPSIIDCPSPNFDQRSLPVSIVVLHYTGMVDAASAFRRLTDPEAKVSAHYMVNEDGQVVQLVEEDKRAWHAGKSYWRGVTDINSASIGIELVNPGHEHGYRPFPEEQMAALLTLMMGIVPRYGITRGNIVGHSDMRHPARRIRASCSIGNGWPSCASPCRARASSSPIRNGPMAASCWRWSASATTSSSRSRPSAPSSAASGRKRSTA
jgi:hypothetical protein